MNVNDLTNYTTQTGSGEARDSPRSVERVAEAKLPTEMGEFRLIGYRSRNSNEEFVVIAAERSGRSVPPWCGFIRNA